MFVMDGANSVYCKSDLCLPLSLVLASFDRTFARTFSSLGICWMYNLSNPDWMTL